MGGAGRGAGGRVDPAVRRAARRVAAFARRHPGDPLDAVLEPLGRDRVRLVLVAADGGYGDLVVTGSARAAAAAELAGARVHRDFPRELAARIRTGDYEWRRMAGSQLGGAGGP